MFERVIKIPIYDKVIDRIMQIFGEVLLPWEMTELLISFCKFEMKSPVDARVQQP